MLKQAVPSVFVKDFQAALAYYTGPLGFRPLFVYGEIPFYAHVARDEAILAIRRVAGPVIDRTAGEDLLPDSRLAWLAEMAEANIGIEKLLESAAPFGASVRRAREFPSRRAVCGRP